MRSPPERRDRKDVPRQVSDKNLPVIERSGSRSRYQEPPKKPELNTQARRGRDEGQDDLFDLDEGAYDVYVAEESKHYSDDESENGHEIYQIYEELVGVVQQDYMKHESGGGRGSDSRSRSKSPVDDVPVSQKKERNRAGWAKKDAGADKKRKAAFEETDSDDDLGRKANPSPLPGTSKISKQDTAVINERYKPAMTGIAEETEYEDTIRASKGFGAGNNEWRKKSTSPAADSKSNASKSTFDLPPDRDDDFSDGSDGEAASKPSAASFTLVPGQGLQAATFMDRGGNGQQAADLDMSKLDTVEKIREYLEAELGVETLVKVYPIIKEFGDDILFMDKIQELKSKLAHLITPE